MAGDLQKEKVKINKNQNQIENENKKTKTKTQKEKYEKFVSKTNLKPHNPGVITTAAGV